MKHSQLETRNKGQQTGKMACPNCGSDIPVTFQALLGAGRLVCENSNCKSILRLNIAGSRDAINAMTKLKTVLRDELGHDVV